MNRPVEVVCDERLAALVRLLAGGALAPVGRFLDSAEATWVAAHHRLPDGGPCPVPPTCDLPAGSAAEKAQPGGVAVLLAEDLTPIARLTVTGNEVVDGRVRLSGPLDAPARGAHTGELAGDVVAIAPFDTNPAALRALPGAVQLALPPHRFDDPRPARRIAEVRAEIGARPLVTLTTPWPDRDPASVAHQALAAVNGGAPGLLLPATVADAFTELRPDIPVQAVEDLDQRRELAAGQGLTVFFTGLSGSGKSTLARALATRLAAAGRTVTLLDGDVVRTHLSAGLGFDRAARDANIRRIGYVAAEVTKHGGVAICAPIAPYEQARRDARAAVEQYGRFLLVHVATPLSVCEERDSKGLYARARAGELPGFTGVSDPYEPPDDAELRLDTSQVGLEEAVNRLMALLGE